MRRVALLALGGAGAAVGVLAEQQAYDWADPRGWLPDLLAGWTLIGLGIALLALRRPAGAAALLLAAGFSWFAFNFEHSGPTVVEWLAVQGRSCTAARFSTSRSRSLRAGRERASPRAA